jgi:Spy/CpxP family protein refolding chaperone
LTRLVAGVIALTLLAAVAGGWVGVRYGLEHPRRVQGLDEFLHHRLNLSPDQDRQISTLESEFAQHRKSLESEMRAANHELADALSSEHAYGPRAKGAIERFHTAAAALQEETIAHILAMRAVLTPDQAQRFDATVTEALTSERP